MRRAFLVGGITTVVFTYVRGGFADAPWVLVVFGMVGYYGSLFLTWLCRPETLARLQTSSHNHARTAPIRIVLALSFCMALAVWSGPIIMKGGFGGWILAIFALFGASVVVCLLTDRFGIFLGIISATCIELSLVWENARQSQIVENSRWFTIWIIGVSISLMVSVPIQLGRRRHRLALAESSFPPGQSLATPAAAAPLPAGEPKLEASNLKRQSSCAESARSNNFAKQVAIGFVWLTCLIALIGYNPRWKAAKIQYLTKANWHSGKAVDLIEARAGHPITELSELEKLEKEYSRDDPRIAWHRRMSFLYWHAADHPWMYWMGVPETPPPPGYQPSGP